MLDPTTAGLDPTSNIIPSKAAEALLSQLETRMSAGLDFRFVQPPRHIQNKISKKTKLFQYKMMYKALFDLVIDYLIVRN